MLPAFPLHNCHRLARFVLFVAGVLAIPQVASAQGRKLEQENIQRAIDEVAPRLAEDPLRPAFHLTPLSGCMGDPNGGIYKDGWYHIFYGQQPFGPNPGGWYWGHARSRDLLHWEHLPPSLTPAFELGLNGVGSGSTFTTADGKTIAFYSSGNDGEMKFWRAEMDDDLKTWTHTPQTPVLTLSHPGLPPFDDFWRDPFVFEADGRTFLICCADLFEEDYVPVPIFEAQDAALTEWEYRGILFTYPKHKRRNFEVPELRPIGDKWILLASTDAPVDRCYYFIGDFDTEKLTFVPESEGVLDHSGNYYAQETILEDDGDLFVMAWMPGWDRDWLPKYRNHPKKYSDDLWNGTFALPRKLTLNDAGRLIQEPVDTLKDLRGESYTVPAQDLPVSGPIVDYVVLDEIHGDQLEIEVELSLNAASHCGLNLLANDEGHAGFYIQWSGDMLDVDGVEVPLPEWQPGDTLKLRIFLDKRWVEVFINGGQECASRQVPKSHIKGDRISLTSLGGTARLVSLRAWEMGEIQQEAVDIGELETVQ